MMSDFSERLFRIFSQPDFLSMRGLANEVPIFIQAYDPAKEDDLRRTVANVATRLRNAGVVLKVLDLFEVILEVLAENNLLEELIQNETSFQKMELLETLMNYSNPKNRLIPRLTRDMGEDGVQLTLITGPGRVFPFLRTHTLLESLQPAMLRRPVVLFFPGDYIQEPSGGSQLRLFGSIPIPRINNPYYRATNLDHYRL
jgi:hypothetical protein